MSLRSTTSPRKLSNEQRAALLELAFRKKLREGLLERSFAQQREFVLDDTPLLAAQCSRRAGKTMSVAKKFIRAAYKRPGASSLYVGQTGESAERMLKKDCLDIEHERLKINARYNSNKKRFLYPNGSMLYLLGMDASEKEREKALGQKYVLIDIDEAQSFGIDLEDLVYRVLKPAVADYRGQIVLSGTPCNDLYTFYFNVVTAKAVGWKVHKWRTEDNPFMCEQWLAEIADLVERIPKVRETSWFKQQYLNEWVIDASRLVYKYKSDRDLIFTFPPGEYTNVIGLDLGYDDSTAFSVLGYKEHDFVNYVRESWKRSEMVLGEVQRELKRLIKKYDPVTHIVVDNASKQAVETIKRKMNIPMIAAEKTHKKDFIELLNDDFKVERIKLLDSTTGQLQTELQTLTWDEKKLIKGKKEEKDGIPNDCCDTFLYSWRFCYSFFDRGPKPQEKTVEERMEEEDDEDYEAEESREWYDR